MIDVEFNFTSDSPGYWDGFWQRNDGLGFGGSDPDSVSVTLQNYHALLWSKPLPNGEEMELKKGAGPEYLTWKDFRFGSDSIVASFRYKRNIKLVNEMSESMDDYRGFMESFLRKAYTIGGMMIFPKMHGSINQQRGCNKYICDRWDLTLECIRRFYNGKKSPLSDCLERNQGFFELFIDFKGFVDFFFLQDCVLEDYSKVKLWMGEEFFEENPLPKNLLEYKNWLDTQLEFVELRNERIKRSLL